MVPPLIGGGASHKEETHVTDVGRIACARAGGCSHDSHCHDRGCVTRIGRDAEIVDAADAITQRHLCAGRVTIMAGSVPIGAIGVSSAPGGQFDEAGNFDVAEELSQLRSSRPIPTSTLPRPIGCISG